MLYQYVTAFIFLLSACWTSPAVVAYDAPPDPDVGHFAVTESSGKRCLLLDIAATFRVNYEKNDGTTGVVSYALPIDSVATGTCASTLGSKADISLGFFTGYPQFGLKMGFERSGVLRPKSFLSSIQIYYTLDPSIFPDAKYVNETNPLMLTDLHEFETSTSKSYLCESNATFTLGFPGVTQLVDFTVDYIKVQPFDVHKQEFSAAEECPEDHALSTLPAESTTAPPVTTPTPGIPVGHFSLKNDQGEVCLLASWGVRFHVEYETLPNGTATAQYVLPTDANAVGACEDHYATISLRFKNDFDITAIFQSNGTKFSIDNLAVTYKESLPHFPSSKHPNKTTMVTAKNLDLFLVDVGKSYLCKARQSLEIGGANVTLEIIDWQVQPFAVKNGTFGDATECSQDGGTTTMLPISNATTILPTTTVPSPTNHTHTIAPATNQTTPGPTNHTHTPKPPPTTPMPTPGPAGEPKQGHYKLKNSKNDVCLLADMGLQFTASYTKKNKHTGKGVFNVPVKASASGNCGDEKSSLILTFYEGSFNVTFDFQKSAKGGGKTKYHVSSISLAYTEMPAVFPGSLTPNKAHTVSNNGLAVFPADQDRSCAFFFSSRLN